MLQETNKDFQKNKDELQQIQTNLEKYIQLYNELLEQNQIFKTKIEQKVCIFNL